MKFILSLIVLLSISGCVTSKVITGPDGSFHHLIYCGDIESCYEKATEICGKYKIINTSSETSGGNGTTSTSQRLLVKCE